MNCTVAEDVQSVKMLTVWCPGPDSNRHATFAAADFKSAASTDSATGAALANDIAHVIRYDSRATPLPFRRFTNVSNPRDQSGRTAHGALRRRTDVSGERARFRDRTHSP